MQMDVCSAEITLLQTLAKICASFCDGTQTAQMTHTASRYQLKYERRVARLEKQASAIRHRNSKNGHGKLLSRRQR